MEKLVEILIEWGYVGAFISALLAGTIVPFSSELVVAALIKVGSNPALCLISAAIGNTLGGVTCYWLGWLGKTEWITKYLKVKPEKIEKVMNYLQGKGAASFMAFFTFLPFIGEAIAVALGFLRSNPLWTTVSMFIGKFIRYAVIVWGLMQI